MTSINTLTLASLPVMLGIVLADNVKIGQCNIEGQSVLWESDVRGLAAGSDSDAVGAT